MQKAKTAPWPLSWIYWYLEWAIPGLGMYSEAYIVFCEYPRISRSTIFVRFADTRVCTRSNFPILNYLPLVHPCMYAAAGQIGSEQLAAFPTCFGPPYSSCEYDIVKHVGSYILVGKSLTKQASCWMCIYPIPAADNLSAVVHARTSSCCCRSAVSWQECCCGATLLISL